MEDESAKLTFDYQNGGINVLKPLGDRVVLKAETEEEKIFYLKLEELKTQLLQKKLIAKGVY